LDRERREYWRKERTGFNYLTGRVFFHSMKLRDKALSMTVTANPPRYACRPNW
jgi:hypothetical protein